MQTTRSLRGVWIARSRMGTHDSDLDCTLLFRDVMPSAVALLSRTAVPSWSIIDWTMSQNMRLRNEFITESQTPCVQLKGSILELVNLPGLIDVSPVGWPDRRPELGLLRGYTCGEALACCDCSVCYSVFSSALNPVYTGIPGTLVRNCLHNASYRDHHTVRKSI